MKIKKVWAIFLTVIALSLCACGPNTDKTDKTERIYKAAADIVEFLNCVKESGNYSSVSEYECLTPRITLDSGRFWAISVLKPLDVVPATTSRLCLDLAAKSPRFERVAFLRSKSRG